MNTRITKFRKDRLGQKKPIVSVIILLLFIVASIAASVIAPYSPEMMDSSSVNMAPSMEHILGTDTLGRDLFTLVLYGGRASLYIGFLSGMISTVIAVMYGCISGLAPRIIDDLMMRFVDMMLSIPSILLIIFLQAIWGNATCTSISVVIGITTWMNISKIIRSEVRQIRNSDYILAARTMGAGFLYTMWHHLLPNFISSVMFMVVTNIGHAMITESTLSFLGLGLPLTTVSWGSLLSMSQDALLGNCWWIIVIPGTVLVVTLVAITEIGEYIRKKNNRLYSNL